MSAWSDLSLWQKLPFLFLPITQYFKHLHSKVLNSFQSQCFCLQEKLWGELNDFTDPSVTAVLMLNAPLQPASEHKGIALGQCGVFLIIRRIFNLLDKKFEHSKNLRSFMWSLWGKVKNKLKPQPLFNNYCCQIGFLAQFLHSGQHCCGVNKHFIWAHEHTCTFSGPGGAVIVMAAWNSKDKQRSLSSTLDAENIQIIEIFGALPF